MRKQTKIAALVSAAALLTIGAAMTSFAAKWDVEDGQWVYLDNDGEKVEYEWKKSGADWYYLGEGGYMATDQLLEPDENGDVYYVGADGRRVINDWRSVPNEDGDEINGTVVDTLWYYFGANGKAYRAKDNKEFAKKTVPWSGGSNVFFFDANGRMASGWMDYTDNDNKNNRYYLGDESEGWARAKGVNGSTGWYYLEVPDEWNAGPSGSYEDEEWFYFQTSGKAQKASEADYESKYIDGYYYTFDYNGILQDKWFEVASANVASTAAAFTGVDGVKTGWVYTTSKQDEDSTEWYYLVNTAKNKAVAFGSIYNGDEDPGDAKKNYIARTINGKTYLFNALGQMVNGVIEIKGTRKESGSGYDYTNFRTKWNNENTLVLAPGYYLFSKADHSSGGKDGRMLTGKQSVVNDDGETEYYYFAKSEKDGLKKGQAYTDELIDGCLYGAKGVRINAEDGNSYELVTIGDSRLGSVVWVKGKNGVWTGYDKASFLVGSNGKVKNTKITYDDMVYEIENYVVRYMYPKGTAAAQQHTSDHAVAWNTVE